MLLSLVAERRRLNDALIDEKKRVSDAKIAKLNEKREGLYMNRKPKILGGSVKPQLKKSKPKEQNHNQRNLRIPKEKVYI